MDTHLCVQHSGTAPCAPDCSCWHLGVWGCSCIPGTAAAGTLSPLGPQPLSSHTFRAKSSLGNSPWAKPEFQAGEFRGGCWADAWGLTEPAEWLVMVPSAKTRQIELYISRLLKKTHQNKTKWFFLEVRGFAQPCTITWSSFALNLHWIWHWNLTGGLTANTHPENVVSLLSGAGCLWLPGLSAWIICSLTTWSYFSSFL